MVPGTASAGEPVAVDVARQAAIISDEEVDGRPLEFGALVFDPTIEAPVGIPGTNEVVGVLEGDRRVARLDVRTGRLQIGDSVPHTSGFRKLPTITSDGQSVVVFSTDTNRVVRAHRYNLETLSLGSTVNLTPALGANEVVFGAHAVAGGGDAIVVHGRRIAFLVDEIGIAPNRVVTASELYDVDASVPGRAVVSVGVDDDIDIDSLGGIHALEIDDQGLTLGERIIEGFADFDGLFVRGDEIVTQNAVHDLDGNRLRTATPFDLAIDDPTEPLRYTHADSSPVVVFDEVDGEALTEGRECRFSSGYVVIGNGLAAKRGAVGGTVIVNVLDACGSYGEFTPVDPARVLDTRTGQGLGGAPARINGGDTLRVKIHGFAGVPEDGVESVVLNVTGLRQRDTEGVLNFVTVWPAGFEQPTVSNLNIGENEVVGNMVTVSTAAGGFVDVYSDVGTMDLTIDVMGYFASATAPAAARFQNVDNVRLVDTRETGTPLGEGRRLTVDASESRVVQETVADEIVALVVNVTAVQPTKRSHFRIFPNGAPVPDASSANFEARRNTNRLVTVKSAGGAIDVWNSEGETHLTVDLVGVYVDGGGFVPAGGRFIGLVPFRELDTRVDSPFEGNGSIPEEFLISMPGWRSHIELVVNLTAIRPTRTGFLSAGPWTGDFEPFLETSALNFGPNAVVANQSIIRTSSDGEIGVFNGAGNTHVAMDVFGFYTP